MSLNRTHSGIIETWNSFFHCIIEINGTTSFSFRNVHTNTWFTFLWTLSSTYSAVSWKLCQLQWHCSGCWACIVVKLLSLQCSWCVRCTEGIAVVSILVFFCSHLIILEYWLWRLLLSICKLLLCILCMLCNLIFFFSCWFGIYSHSNKQL